jgi:peptidoglycan/LPS O-acetylase OafA/YrhL
VAVWLPVDVRADRFPLADGLRAIAALAVFGTHAFLLAGAVTSASTVARYTMRLEVGVTIFFVLSGFLLYRPFVRARLRGEPAPRTGPYAWRRFLRIAPAYWVALTAAALLLGTTIFTLPEGILFYGLGQAYSLDTFAGGLTQAWSLTIEVAFYAFLPLWAALMRRLGTGPGTLRTELAGLAVLALVAAAWKAAVLSGGDGSEVVITPSLVLLPAWLDVFAAGMALGLLTVLLEDGRARTAAVAWVERHGTACWVVAAVLFWVVSTRIGLGDRLLEPMTSAQYAARHYLYAGIAIAIVVPGVIGAGGLARRLLATRVLAWLGLISYGIFLWHLTVLGLFADWGLGDQTVVHPYVAWTTLGLAGAVLVAAASYYGLERRALRLKGLFPDRAATGPEATAEPAPVTPPAAARVG